MPFLDAHAPALLTPARQSGPACFTPTLGLPTLPAQATMLAVALQAAWRTLPATSQSALAMAGLGMARQQHPAQVPAQAENPHAHCFLASLDATTGKVAWAIAFTGELQLCTCPLHCQYGSPGLLALVCSSRPLLDKAGHLCAEQLQLRVLVFLIDNR